MAARRTIKTQVGDIRIFEKSCLVPGCAEPLYFKMSVDNLDPEFFVSLVTAINAAYTEGIKHTKKEVSQTLNKLLNP